MQINKHRVWVVSILLTLGGCTRDSARSLTDAAYTQTMSFDGSVYPGSCMQKARACAMQVWTSARKAVCSYQEQGRFERELDLFLETVLKLHGYVAQAQEPEDKSSVSEAEITSLLGVVKDVERYFDIVMFGRISDQASCVKVILQKVQNKIEQMTA